MAFVDTNILLRSHPSARLYAVVKNALTKLNNQNGSLCIAPQNLIEFWAVATRPLNLNGLELAKLRALFQVLPYTADVLPTWERIVVAHGVSGKQAQNAHIVAIMQVHSVASILTFNGDDFRRYRRITVLIPVEF